MSQIQMPSVAGMFYPADTDELDNYVTRMIDNAAQHTITAPKALIAPHAGYIYSGPVAASAYKALAGVAGKISRVVLLAPSHRVAFSGLAVSSADFFHTPLGDIPVDQDAVNEALKLEHVHRLDRAFEGEHALEVHLPFLQKSLESFKIVPFIVGDADGEAVARVLETLWGGDETLIVVSSDLSHYLDYATARERDSRTSHAIESLEPQAIDYHDACGRNPVKGLLIAAKKHGLQAETLDLRNSGDTAGSKDKVVGYGAYVFH